MITTIRRQVIKFCPCVDEIDVGELVIEIPGEAPELHNLDRAVDKLASASAITHEDFTAAVAAMLPRGSEATTIWQTGKWRVEVRERARSDGAVAA